jgi:hypothetical protein
MILRNQLQQAQVNYLEHLLYCLSWSLLLPGQEPTAPTEALVWDYAVGSDSWLLTSPLSH